MKFGANGYINFAGLGHHTSKLPLLDARTKLK
jgi:hypothetical protein